MKPMTFGILLSIMALGTPLAARSNPDFKGLIDNLPDSRIGDWIIGSRTVTITAKTIIDEHNGKAEVGTCVSVSYEGIQVKGITTEIISQCLPE